jgi:hypothetical protein
VLIFGSEYCSKWLKTELSKRLTEVFWHNDVTHAVFGIVSVATSSSAVPVSSTEIVSSKTAGLKTCDCSVTRGGLDFLPAHGLKVCSFLQQSERAVRSTDQYLRTVLSRSDFKFLC